MSSIITLSCSKLVAVCFTFFSNFAIKKGKSESGKDNYLEQDIPGQSFPRRDVGFLPSAQRGNCILSFLPWSESVKTVFQRMSTLVSHQVSSHIHRTINIFLSNWSIARLKCSPYSVWVNTIPPRTLDSEHLGIRWMRVNYVFLVSLLHRNKTYCTGLNLYQFKLRQSQ